MTAMEVRLRPNELQLGLSQYALLSFAKFPRQLHEYPPGVGKSRVIHMLAVQLLTSNQAPRVAIITHSTSLLLRDQTEFADYSNLIQTVRGTGYRFSARGLDSE